MKAINIGISGKDKKVKKALVNRSRSSNVGAVVSRCENPRPNVSPFRNSIGLKSYQQLPNKKTIQNIRDLNQDYYQIKKLPQEKNKVQKKSNNELYFANKFQSKRSQKKQTDVSTTEQIKKEISTPVTTQTSKISKQSKWKNQCMNSEYLGNTYLSPTSKLRHLERQKNKSKQKLYQNYQKIVNKQSTLKQEKSKNQLVYQMYEKIICNLKKQNREAKSSVILDEKLYQKLKNSGSLETQSDDHSN